MIIGSPPPPGTQGPTSRGFASERLSVTQSCIHESVLDTLALHPPKSSACSRQAQLPAPLRPNSRGRRRARSGGREVSSSCRYDSTSQPTSTTAASDYAAARWAV